MRRPVSWLAAAPMAAGLHAQAPAPPYLYVEVLDDSGKPLQPRQGVIRVPNHNRIRLQIQMRVRSVEDRFADLFIAARNQHPDTKRVPTVRLRVSRLAGGRKLDAPLRIYSSGGGQSLTRFYVSVDFDILDDQQKREREIREYVERVRAEAGKQGAASRALELGGPAGSVIGYFDELYVNNPPGRYEIVAVYSSSEPGYWTGRLESKPVQVLVEQTGDISTIFGDPKAKR